MVARGQRQHLVTLVEHATDAPLDPPDWYCAVQHATGQATMIGDYHPGITTNTRIHHKGRVYHVDAITNREDRDLELVLTCREVFD